MHFPTYLKNWLITLINEKKITFPNLTDAFPPRNGITPCTTDAFPSFRCAQWKGSEYKVETHLKKIYTAYSVHHKKAKQFQSKFDIYTFWADVEFVDVDGFHTGVLLSFYEVFDSFDFNFTNSRTDKQKQNEK